MVLQRFVTEPGNVACFGVIPAAGLAFGAGPTLLHSAMADPTDIDELKTGQNAWLYLTFATINKLGGAVAVGVTLTAADKLLTSPRSELTSSHRWPSLFSALYPQRHCADILPLYRYPLTKEKQWKLALTVTSGVTQSAHENLNELIT